MVSRFNTVDYLVPHLKKTDIKLHQALGSMSDKISDLVDAVNTISAALPVTPITPGTGIADVPPVTITGPAKVIPRETDQVEVDVPWVASNTATKDNFVGVAVYVEDPDISSGTESPLDGNPGDTTTGTSLDGTSQLSGHWNPTRDKDATKSPVAVLIPEGKEDRQVRIYLAAIGPHSTPKLVRANDTTDTPTPSVVATVPAVSDTYVSGMEVAWLVTDVGVKVNTEYDLAPPLYTLTFSYLPPTGEQESHLPPGLSEFGGVAIWYKYFDDGRLTQAMQHPYVSTADPVGQVQTWKSTEYPASKGSFRVYFVSMDVGGDQNSIVDGITPSVDVSIYPTVAVPKISNLKIVPGSASVMYLPDGSYVSIVTFSWDLPVVDLVRYSGMFLYRVATTGAAPCPQQIWPQTPVVDTQAVVDVSNIPSTPETWTIAGISVDFNGQMEDDPSTYGNNPNWTSPTVAWTVGPPGIGVIGGGQEYAPLVTINAGATVVSTESTSSDGVRMVTFAINGTNGAWTNPTDNRFGGAWIALVVHGDYGHAIYWRVPKGDNHFTTPAIGAPGAFGQPIDLAFFILSQDPQDHRNTLQPAVTPYIPLNYTPTEGTIIPSRNPLTPQWLSSEFFWSNNDLTVSSIGANKIQVGSVLQVGGKNSFGPSAANGQIGVFDSFGTLVAWIGTTVYDGSAKQNPVPGTYGGAWFGQLWVGGDSPSHAPLYVSSYGIVVVGGIAAAPNAPYPYISVRDNYGIEKGRIGAQLTSSPPASQDPNAAQNVPTSLTAGAWFSQFAAGGNPFTPGGQWQVLIDGSVSPGKFYIRDMDQFSISYAANPVGGGGPSNPAYNILMGKGVWSGVGSTNKTYQFPGIQIYESSGTLPDQIFGSVLLNRGLVLRGTSSQSYRVLAELVTFNGDSNGSDIPSQFWGQLVMYSAIDPTRAVVDLGSGAVTLDGNGNPINGTTIGDSHFYLSSHTRDSNGNYYNFTVDEKGEVHIKGPLYINWGVNNGPPAKMLIDTNGNWVGGGMGVQSVVGSGPGISVTGTSAVIVTNTGITQVSGGTGVHVSGTGTVIVSIDQSVATNAQPQFAYVSTTGIASGSNIIGYGGAAFGGAGVYCPGSGVACQTLTLTPNDSVQQDAIHVVNAGTSIKCVDYNGIWSGNGVQCYSPIYGSVFGIMGNVVGVSGTFTSADGHTITVTGGLITHIA